MSDQLSPEGIKILREHRVVNPALINSLEEFSIAMFGDLIDIDSAGGSWDDLTPQEQSQYISRSKGILAIAARTRIGIGTNTVGPRKLAGKPVRVTRTIVYEGDEEEVNRILSKSLLNADSSPKMVGRYFSICLAKEVREDPQWDNTTGKNT